MIILGLEGDVGFETKVKLCCFFFIISKFQMLIFSMMEDDEVFLPNSDSDEVVSVAPSSSNIRNDEIVSFYISLSLILF